MVRTKNLTSHAIQCHMLYISIGVCAFLSGEIPNGRLILLRKREAVLISVALAISGEM